MKGKLFKTEKGWEVTHVTPDEFVSPEVLTVPLHPEDSKTYDWLYQSYTVEEFNKEPTDVDFTFETIACGTTEFDVMDQDVARLASPEEDTRTIREILLSLTDTMDRMIVRADKINGMLDLMLSKLNTMP